jgi:hypothetical protein
MYTIPCSFGEIIDKATILELKLKNKRATEAQKVNIQAEYDGIKAHLSPLLDKEKMAVFTKTVDELRRINQILWGLEDSIRDKSRNRTFDGTYIQVAEAIHKTNDDRYKKKRILNSLVGSTLIEEKLYLESLETVEDHAIYNRARKAFDQGNYETSLRLFERLCEKFKDMEPNVFLCSLISSYDTNVAFLGVENKFTALMDKIAPRVREYVPDEAHCNHIILNYGMNLLRRKQYGDATEYLRYMNALTAPKISPETMSYFPPGSTGMTLLIYMGGGIGDKIMFGRFIPQVCREQAQNKIVLLADDNLYWFFSKVFDEPNLIVLPYAKRQTLAFNYHTNIHMLPHWLGLEYKDIYEVTYLKGPFHTPILLPKFTKRTIMINWHGNFANSLERLNRGISLDLLAPLLALKNIQWISTQKEFTPEEKSLLIKYGVLNLGPDVDNEGDAYKDTLAIMNHCDLVISTDTSFVHVAGTAGIPCWVLLTRGCEWRWTQDTTTKWYPSMKLFRQKTAGSWGSVVSEVKTLLEKGPQNMQKVDIATLD